MSNFNLNFNEYTDKVKACWIGKNIGGTMGAPYEGTHDVLDVKGFATEFGAPLPNDDLDLQLVWLHAAERIGVKNVNAHTLGLLWNSLIVAEWNEYGVAQINMKRGLRAPLSGDYKNLWKHSNGAWIRTEIWACLFPATPSLAAKFAIEDAKVDHGVGEGTTAAAFVASMQSAAFVLEDIRECIELALMSIPEDSRVADSIRLVIKCYDDGISAIEARNTVQQRNADMAGGWFEAPSNVAYAVIGLMYGKGDFKSSMLYAINCGDDTDCTAATVGATLGILGGTAAIPEDWSAHIGDRIITLALNRTGVGATLPKTIQSLTERVTALAPHTLFDEKSEFSLVDRETVLPEDLYAYLKKQFEKARASLTFVPESFTVTSPILDVSVCYENGIDIAAGDEKHLSLTINNHSPIYDATSYSLSFRWWLPDGFEAEGKKSFISRNNYIRNEKSDLTEKFIIKAGECVGASNRLVLEISIEGTPELVYVPIVFLG